MSLLENTIEPITINFNLNLKFLSGMLLSSESPHSTESCLQ